MTTASKEQLKRDRTLYPECPHHVFVKDKLRYRPRCISPEVAHVLIEPQDPEDFVGKIERGEIGYEILYQHLYFTEDSLINFLYRHWDMSDRPDRLVDLPQLPDLNSSEAWEEKIRPEAREVEEELLGCIARARLYGEIDDLYADADSGLEGFRNALRTEPILDQIPEGEFTRERFLRRFRRATEMVDSYRAWKLYRAVARRIPGETPPELRAVVPDKMDGVPNVFA